MKDIYISIIIPIYNAERYLDRCIQSLHKQTLNDIEIILVNDGSTDNSLRICENHKKLNNRINIISTANGGTASARNIGLENANGEYILFLDADDKISTDSCEKLYQHVEKYENVDIIAAGALMVNGENNYNIGNVNVTNGMVYSGREYMRKVLIKKNFQVIVCRNLYRKKFLLENQLFFKENLSYEDEEWSIRTFYKAKTVLPINFKFYCYFVNPDSKMTTDNINIIQNRILDIIKTCKSVFEFITLIKEKDLRIMLNDRTANLILWEYFRIQSDFFAKELKKSSILEMNREYSFMIWSKIWLFKCSSKLLLKIHIFAKKIRKTIG